jgi:hypothetical protein
MRVRPGRGAPGGGGAAHSGDPRRGANCRFQAAEDEGGGNVSPASTLFGTKGGLGDGRGVSRASIGTLLHNREAKLSACECIYHVWGILPNIRKAMMLMALSAW